jgi:hypothetical protein
MFIKIYAQYQENYGYYDGGKEHWKNKGGTEFIWKPSDSSYFYNDTEMDEIVAREYLKRNSNELCRYTLVSCEREYCDFHDVSAMCDLILTELEQRETTTQ